MRRGTSINALRGSTVNEAAGGFVMIGLRVVAA
jgi:hypothetical protein